MQFCPEQLLQLLAKPGLLIRFKPGTVFGNTNPHLAVVVNFDPNTQKAVVVVCASSQVDRRVNFAKRRGFPMSTLVRISGGSHSHFGQDTVFDCNTVETIPYELLVEWCSQQNAEIITRNGIIDQTLLQSIQAGVMISDMVAEEVKDKLRSVNVASSV